MHLILSTISTKRRPVLVVCALLIAAALGAFGFVREKTNGATLANPGSSGSSLIKTEAAGSPVAVVPQNNSAHIEAELIVLRPTGFEPAVVTRPSGVFLLAIDNRTGLENVTIRLERANGVREGEVQLVGHRVRWRKRVNLPPGEYAVKVAGHPEWVCPLTLTAR